MALPAAGWRYVGMAPFASSATFTAIIAAFLSLGQATTYANGTARTPGSGAAGTWTEVATGEAISVTPALSPLNHRLLIAGSATSVAGAVAASPDTTALNVLMTGVNKNSGAYSNWKSATPYTSGQWFGFWRNFALASGAGAVYLWESPTSIYVVITSSGGTASQHFLLGCPVDPQSTDTVNDAESDGRLYGQMTTGGSAINVATILSSPPATNILPFGHSGTASQQHMGVFTPGGSTLITCQRAVTLAVAGTTTGLRSRSSKFAAYPIPVRATAAAPNDQTLGQLYGVSMFTNMLPVTQQVYNGNVIGYLIGEDVVTVQESLLLEYA